jgi:cytochrome c-type biogenesis protein CcmE
MKSSSIVILVVMAAAIVGLVTFGLSSSDFSTYDSIASAKNKQGKFVHIIAKLDRTIPMEYDPVKNPNYLSFNIVDSLGSKTQVVYHNSKPAELENSERVVLQGKMQGDIFECRSITLKCPSKYKDNRKQLEKNVKDEMNTIAQPSTGNTSLTGKDSSTIK